MTIPRLATDAVEKSTYVITSSFVDSTGASVTPNSGLTWTLTDGIGTVVNGRSDVSIASASSINIVLSGDDLALSDIYAGRVRVVTVQGTYNSSLGNNLPIKQQCSFVITDLVAVN